MWVVVRGAQLSWVVVLSIPLWAIRGTDRAWPLPSMQSMAVWEILVLWVMLSSAVCPFDTVRFSL